MLQPWQAYHGLTYENKWKEEINQSWEEYTTIWAKENPGQPLIKTRFEFMNAFVKEKFEAETPEMKERVEEYRREMIAKSPTENNRAFQR